MLFRSVVEGLIGVGKTSLCRLMRDEWGAELILEPSETNPFLGPFYADPDRYRFPVQMFYLVNRWRQQDRIRQPELFDELIVSDYIFQKDRMFAEKTLDSTELDLYDRFALALDEHSPAPDLVIYLHAPLDTIMERIARRQAVGEDAITREYLQDLSDRYDVLLEGWNQCPVLRLSNDEINYVDSEEGQRRVLQIIDATLHGRPIPEPDGEAVPGSVPDREIQAELFGPGA